MSVFLIIMGILMVIAGIACLVTPIATTFGVMYFFMILLFVSGIMLIIRSIAYRRFGLGLVFGIISVILGGFLVFSPSLAIDVEVIILYIMAGWLVVRGIIGIVDACRAKKFIGGGTFALALIVSILVIITGVYSLFNPMVFAFSLGILASCYFIVEGVDMVVLGCIGKNVEDAVVPR